MWAFNFESQPTSQTSHFILIKLAEMSKRRGRVKFHLYNRIMRDRSNYESIESGLSSESSIGGAPYPLILILFKGAYAYGCFRKDVIG